MIIIMVFFNLLHFFPISKMTFTVFHGRRILAASQQL